MTVFPIKKSALLKSYEHFRIDKMTLGEFEFFLKGAGFLSSEFCNISLGFKMRWLKSQLLSEIPIAKHLSIDPSIRDDDDWEVVN